MGGNAARKRREELETPEERTTLLADARLKPGFGGANVIAKRRREEETPEQKAARCLVARQKTGAAYSVQTATQLLSRLVNGVDEDAESLMVEMDDVIDVY